MTTIKELRLAKGWTQEDLAFHARLSVRTISQVEREKPTNKNTVNRLCDVLGVPLEAVTGANYRQKDAIQGSVQLP